MSFFIKFINKITNNHYLYWFLLPFSQILIGTIIGALLWYIFNSPAMAVIAMVCIDFIGGIPTQVHCWEKPHEETLSMFIMSGISALFTILAIQEWKITAFAFPLFLLVINIDYILMISLRRVYLKKKR